MNFPIIPRLFFNRWHVLFPYRRWKGQFMRLRHSYELCKMSGFPLQSAPDRAVFWAIQFKSHQLRTEPWCTVLSPSLFLSVEFGAIVSGTWNQPAYKNQTELQKHVVFSTSKKYNPIDWRFWCYRNCSLFCSSSRALCFRDSSLRERTSKRRNRMGSSNCWIV